MRVQHASAPPHLKRPLIQSGASQGFSGDRVQKHAILGTGASAITLNLKGKQKFLMNRQHDMFAPLHREPIDFVSIPINLLPSQANRIRPPEARSISKVRTPANPLPCLILSCIVRIEIDVQVQNSTISKLEDVAETPPGVCRLMSRAADKSRTRHL
jgi:hypothetical protein